MLCLLAFLCDLTLGGIEVSGEILDRCTVKVEDTLKSVLVKLEADLVVLAVVDNEGQVVNMLTHRHVSSIYCTLHSSFLFVLNRDW